MGRFAEIVLKYGGTVVGIDLSFAVDAAYTNLGANAGASFIQANVFELPFKQSSFDLIYSLGVLHHTPDPRRAFGMLPPLLRPGGTIMITLYSANNKAYVAASEFWRRLTTRLPGPLLYKLAHLSIPLYYLWRLPKIGKLFSTLLPISMHRRPEWRVLDTYDWYSPRYQFYYTHPEVFGWFEDEGLGEIKVRGPGISLAGRRPAA
jgi:SAM-dependent methyltransferase